MGDLDISFWLARRLSGAKQKREGYGFFGTVTVTEVVAVLPEASVAE